MPDRTNDTQQVVGVSIGLVAVLVSTFLEWQLAGEVPTTTLLLIAVIGSAVAGRILVPSGERLRAQLVAMASGALAGGGGFVLVGWWISSRSSVHTLEFLLATLLGAAPGWLVGSVAYAKVRRNDEPVPTAVARPRAPE